MDLVFPWRGTHDLRLPGLVARDKSRRYLHGDPLPKLFAVARRQGAMHLDTGVT